MSKCLMFKDLVISLACCCCDNQQIFLSHKHKRLQNLPFPTMSTTSTVTTLVAQDQTPSNEVDLLNSVCILVLTRGDGTPFDDASIQEEDMIEICLWLGHTHPRGVLWYSVVKLVMLFHCADEMLVILHGVIKAMILHKESIKRRDFSLCHPCEGLYGGNRWETFRHPTSNPR